MAAPPYRWGAGGSGEWVAGSNPKSNPPPPLRVAPIFAVGPIINGWGVHIIGAKGAGGKNMPKVGQFWALSPEWVGVPVGPSTPTP